MQVGWPLPIIGIQVPTRPMKQSRREFVKKTGMAAAMAGVLSPTRSLAALIQPRRRLVEIAHRPHQVLHVMADLVRDNVRLREIARRAEAVVQLLEKRRVEVELPVGRAVERSGSRARLSELVTTDLRKRTSLGGS